LAVTICDQNISDILSYPLTYRSDVSIYDHAREGRTKMTNIFTLTWKDLDGVAHAQTFNSDAERYAVIVQITKADAHCVYQASTEYAE
jgi:hypothetical protein